VYRETNPDYVLALVKRVAGTSAPAAHQLVSALLRACDSLLAIPYFTGDNALRELREQIRSANTSLET
jgi:hypothetical protein